MAGGITSMRALSKVMHKIDTLELVVSLFRRYLPKAFLEFFLRSRFHSFLSLFIRPYMQINFHEVVSGGAYLRRNQAYAAIESYLSSKSTLLHQGTKLTAEVQKRGASPIYTMEDFEDVHDVFNGIRVIWCRMKSEEKQRYYRLTFHHRYREIITGEYVDYVLREGERITEKQKQRKLFTKASRSGSSFSTRMWSHVVFEHPATFETLAMDPEKKKEIVDDLVTFSESKQYYARVGKPWKRGYLLHGPPGTGKSTMIAAISNLLNYDIYDLELTAVDDNSELRKLLIEIPRKSIIVVEDIDCSLHVTSKREEQAIDRESEKKIKKDQKSKVTLSGLLNFVDGIWSASVGERIIIFTTNHVEKLDPALIRSGRMDKHIELSYCDFEGFKVLAKNYLGVASHELFSTIKGLLEQTTITPADVAESLVPRKIRGDAEDCLNNLVEVLRKSVN